jgi:hypothetical protein
MSKLYSSSSLGFGLQTQPILDETCVETIDGQSPFCYEGQFLQIITLQNNYWNYDNNLQNVGGILGFALEECISYCTGVFQEYSDKLEMMTVALSPESDFDWWLKSTDNDVNKSLWDYQSIIALNDKKTLGLKGTGSSVTLETEHPDLLFKSDSFKFGSVEFVDKYVEITMGVPGVGLPEPLYMQVAKKLYEAESKIICPSSYGYSCHSTTFCAQLLPSIEDMHFQMHFGDKKTFEVPIAAFMRQTDDQCKILVTNLGTKGQSENIVMGSSFL